jgi:hypothetical protein
MRCSAQRRCCAHEVFVPDPRHGGDLLEELPLALVGSRVAAAPLDSHQLPKRGSQVKNGNCLRASCSEAEAHLCLLSLLRACIT